jgi:6-phosphogluconolactonase
MEPNYNTAHSLVRPDGKFLYVSNRFYDMVSIFKIDQETGRLTLTRNVPSQGSKPRNFAFDLDCKWVYVANMEAGGIVQFTVDEETGGFSATGHYVDAGSPSCVLFQRPGYRISGFGG